MKIIMIKDLSETVKTAAAELLADDISVRAGEMILPGNHRITPDRYRCFSVCRDTGGRSNQRKLYYEYKTESEADSI
jgi:hypothetical protein